MAEVAEVAETDDHPRVLSVLIADDHPLVLAGLRRALERGGDVEVAGEAQSYTQLMALIERRRPDVVLVDLKMPGIEGTEHIEAIRAGWPQIKVVVLSASEDRPSVDAALAAGADAYVVKSVSLSDIPGVVRQVASGVIYHASSGAPSRHEAGADDQPDVDVLTEREAAILQAAARGLTTGEIARELFISGHTVKFHLANIYRKLGVANRTAAVRHALDRGLVES